MQPDSNILASPEVGRGNCFMQGCGKFFWRAGQNLKQRHLFGRIEKIVLQVHSCISQKNWRPIQFCYIGLCKVFC